MKVESARRLAWALFALSALLATVALGFGLASDQESVRTDWGSPGVVGLILLLVPGLAFATVGGLIGTRRPGHVVGWLCLTIGVLWTLLLGSNAIGIWALQERALPRDLAEWLGWVGGLWTIPLGLMGTHLPLRLPEGRLLSPRWRSYSRLCTAVIALVTLLAATEFVRVQGIPGTGNPTRMPWLDPFRGLFVLLPLSFLGGIASVVVRYRRAGAEERHQIRWVAFGGLVFVASFLGVLAALDIFSIPEGSAAFQVLTNLTLLGYAAIPVAIGFSVLKYRLYDIDVVISKTVVFACLAGFITVVYVAIVVGVGSVVGAGGEPKLGLSVAATAVVAVAFGPVRERVQRLANRLVYGVRATPYEVLSAFSARVGETVGSDELLGRMARLLAQGTGARRARVWLRVGDRVRPAAAWPDDDDRPAPQALTGETLPALPDADAVTPVVHHSDLLGALTVSKARGDTLTPTDSTLISDLAAQAGLVLRNVRLTAELYDRLDELRASRQRLVAAQDNERRRLERDLHDGAQQQLVALKIKLGLARTIAEREDAIKAAQVLGQLAGDADDAITTLRDLARGIYPPLLADQGLAVALRAQAAKAPLPVTIHANDLGRYPQDTEAAVYFCCLEALQNTAKYAGATHATITLTQHHGTLEFTVADDGVGFDPDTAPPGSGLQNMADRLDAHGGTLTIDSAPGAGTAITGRLPARIPQPA